MHFRSNPLASQQKNAAVTCIYGSEAEGMSEDTDRVGALGHPASYSMASDSVKLYACMESMHAVNASQQKRCLWLQGWQPKLCYFLSSKRDPFFVQFFMGLTPAALIARHRVSATRQAIGLIPRMEAATFPSNTGPSRGYGSLLATGVSIAVASRVRRAVERANITPRAPHSPCSHPSTEA